MRSRARWSKVSSGTSLPSVRTGTGTEAGTGTGRSTWIRRRSRSSEPTPTDAMNEVPAGSSGPVPSSPSPKGGQRSTREQVGRLFAASGFRRFFLTRMISQLGDGVFQLSAGAVLLFDHPGKNPALALLGVV